MISSEIVLAAPIVTELAPTDVISTPLAKVEPAPVIVRISPIATLVTLSRGITVAPVAIPEEVSVVMSVFASVTATPALLTK